MDFLSVLQSKCIRIRFISMSQTIRIQTNLLSERKSGPYLLENDHFVNVRIGNPRPNQSMYGCLKSRMRTKYPNPDGVPYTSAISYCQNGILKIASSKKNFCKLQSDRFRDWGFPKIIRIRFKVLNTKIHRKYGNHWFTDDDHIRP